MINCSTIGSISMISTAMKECISLAQPVSVVFDLSKVPLGSQDIFELLFT